MAPQKFEDNDVDLVEEATAKNKLLLNSLIRFNVTDPSAESVRICLTFSVICDWDIKLTDVSTAFLHADVIGSPCVFTRIRISGWSKYSLEAK